MENKSKNSKWCKKKHNDLRWVKRIGIKMGNGSKKGLTIWDWSKKLEYTNDEWRKCINLNGNWWKKQVWQCANDPEIWAWIWMEQNGKRIWGQKDMETKDLQKWYKNDWQQKNDVRNGYDNWMDQTLKVMKIGNGSKKLARAPHGFWWGNIVKRKTPRGGGVLSISMYAGGMSKINVMHIQESRHTSSSPRMQESCHIQGGEDPQDALFSWFIFRKRGL